MNRQAAIGRCRRCPAVPVAMTFRCCRLAQHAHAPAQSGHRLDSDLDGGGADLATTPGRQRWREFTAPRAGTRCQVSGMISGTLWPPRAGRHPRALLHLSQMGLIQALAYEVPEPNAAQRAMWHVSSSRPGAWLFAKSGPRLDRFLLRLSKDQVTLAKNGRQSGSEPARSTAAMTHMPGGSRTGRFTSCCSACRSPQPATPDRALLGDTAKYPPGRLHRCRQAPVGDTERDHRRG